MRKILKRFADDYVRYPISNTLALLYVVMAFTAAQDKIDYLILGYLIMLGPHIVKDKT